MNQKDGYVFSEEMGQLFSSEEQEALKSYTLPKLIEAYCERTLRSSVEIQKQLSGDYNFHNSNIRYFKSFYPSARARASWLYLQSLLDAGFGPSYYTVRRDLDSWLLLQTTAGEGFLRYEGKEYSLLPGDVFLIDCHRPHDYRTAQHNWNYRLAHFAGNAMPDYYAPILSSKNVVFHFERDSVFETLFRQLYALSKKDAAENELLENCILTQLLTEVLRTLPQFDRCRYPKRIQDICVWLTEHCCEQLTIQEIADHFSISKYYLCREFRKYTGVTVFSYIEEGRMNVAKQLLRYSGISVAAVAECVGYQDQSNFGRIFRRAEGISPSAYRKKWGGL